VFALVLPDLGDVAVDHLYTYLIPPALSAMVTVGGRVTVPFNARQVHGYVLEITTQSELPARRLKPVSGVVTSRPVFNAEQAALARWLADAYLCPISEALRPCLAEPGALSPRLRWRCVDSPAECTLLPDPTQNAVLAYLRTHPATTSTQVKAQFGEAGESALDMLRRQGLIRPTGRVERTGRKISVVLPALPVARLEEIAATLPPKQVKQARLLQWAVGYWGLPSPPLTAPDVARQAGVSPAVVHACINNGWLTLDDVSLRRNPWDTIRGRKAQPPALTPAQQEVTQAIIAAARHHEAVGFLLFGVTGSGKTEVYLHAIEETLARGRQAIVLVPEISLTAQAMALYHGRFPGRVAVLHSNLSPGERFDEWERIERGEAQVVLGARSAIFAPCPDPGLIIIDEEHESSYKQENSPRYHAKAVALERGRLCGAPVVLASATPSLESMREAELGMYRLLRLAERIEARPLPPVKLVDLRRMTTGARILSSPLRLAIEARLQAGEQTILFLNRRGFAPTLLCQKCGTQESCPYCAVPLTYHQAAGIVRCHHCDFQQAATAVCPRCPGTRIMYKGVGTERLEAEVQQLWPAARIGRLDRDTTTRKGSHHVILDHFAQGETDILVGTQMVAKGFDFPRVTLVGVIAADLSLSIPDFRAPERTFQLLTQVAGRAGRADLPGEVIIQTFQPDHYAIQAAAVHDYESFYRQEIAKRGDAQACWPPLTHMVNVVVSGEREAEVRATAAALARRAREEGAAREELPTMATAPALPNLFDFLTADQPIDEPEEEVDHAELLTGEATGVTVNDAATCPLERLRGRYRYHVVLRGPHAATLRRLASLLQEITPPRGIQVTIDVDPLSLA